MGGPAQGVWGPAGALSKAGHKEQKYSKGKTVFLTLPRGHMSIDHNANHLGKILRLGGLEWATGF